MKRKTVAAKHPEVPTLVPNTEYARRIGVTTRTLFNYDRLGLLPAPKVIRGRKYRDPNVLPKLDAKTDAGAA